MSGDWSLVGGSRGACPAGIHRQRKALLTWNREMCVIVVHPKFPVRAILLNFHCDPLRSPPRSTYHCMKAHPLWRVASLLALFLVSCVFADFTGVTRQVAFNEADFATYAGPGTASVTGQLICSYEGKDHPGQGTPVTLLPVTAYTKEMIERELGDGVTLTPSDSRLKKYIRITNADHQGNFAFRHVPAGDYFVAGEAGWDKADYELHQWACERVTVYKGQVIKIRVAHNPQHGNSPVNNIWTVQ